jgi:hypothetical protein
MMKIMKMTKMRLLALGVAGLGVTVPGVASAVTLWAKLDVPGYSANDTAYLCSDGRQFFTQAVGRTSNGASICFGQAYATGSWQIVSGACDNVTNVTSHLIAGVPKGANTLYCSSPTGAYNQIISCNANMNLRRNSPAAACAFKTATGSGFIGT